MKCGIRTSVTIKLLGVSLIWCVLAPSFVWSRTIAHQKQTPHFRAESEVVLVDLIVTDRQGNFVADLKPEEVQVLEDGMVQEIRFFRLERQGGDSRETHADRVSAHGDAPPEKRPEDEASSPRTRYYTFLMDLQTLDHNSLERSKEAIREFLRSEIDPGDRIMLAAIGPRLRVVQSFTRDLPKLEQALDQISYRPEKASLVEFAAGLLNAHGSKMSPREYVDILVIQADLSSGALSALSRHLGSLPGRKHIIYFSNGYPLAPAALLRRILDGRTKLAQGAPTSAASYGLGNMFPDSTSKFGLFSSSYDMTRKLRTVVDRANRNQVSVHSIDPRGLMLVPFELSRLLDIGDLEASQEFLSTLSEDTGGLMFTNENDLLRPIRAAYRDGRTYYLLGYVPDTERKVGKFREIGVKLRRKGLRLRHRRGYVDQDPLIAAQEELVNAFKFPDLYGDFPFHLDLVETDENLAIRPRIPTAALRFTSKGKQSRCLLEIFGVAFDEHDQPTEKGFFLTKTIDLDFDSQGLETFRGYESFGPWMEKDFPERGRSLVIVLRQKLTGELAAVQAPLGTETHSN